MELTTKQEQGLKIAVQRYKNHEPFTIIAGYAGTGKSTLVTFIVSALELDPVDNVAYIAYTGKAAQVLKDKGCEGAMTAHKLLYHSREQKDGSFVHIPKPSLPTNYKLVIVDEVSMLPAKMWELLLSHHIHVIAMGDPGQLPPIGEEQTVLDTPHIFLDEIVRQAADNEIIRLSQDVRLGKPLQFYQGSTVQILPAEQLNEGMYFWADQVICGRNATRAKINQEIREQIFGDTCDLTLPLESDKIICCRNNWNTITEYGDPLINGAIGTATKVDYVGENRWIGKDVFIDFLPDGIPENAIEQGTFKTLHIDYKFLETGVPSKTKDNWKTFPKFLKPEQFAYGYCVTCWKAQGSEYDKVLFLDENFPFKKDEHIKYLYTGITRAKDKLVLLLDK